MRFQTFLRTNGAGRKAIPTIGAYVLEHSLYTVSAKGALKRADHGINGISGERFSTVFAVGSQG